MCGPGQFANTPSTSRQDTERKRGRQRDKPIILLRLWSVLPIFLACPQRRIRRSSACFGIEARHPGGLLALFLHKHYNRTTTYCTDHTVAIVIVLQQGSTDSKKKKHGCTDHSQGKYCQYCLIVKVPSPTLSTADDTATPSSSMLLPHQSPILLSRPAAPQMYPKKLGLSISIRLYLD